MQIKSYIYPNRLYPAIIQANCVGAFPYRILNCDYTLIKDNKYGSSCPTLNKALEELAEFYNKLEIPAPRPSDLQIQNANIDKDFYIQRRTEHEYYIYVGSHHSEDRRFIIKDCLTLEKAIVEAEKIIAICEGK